MGTTITLNPFVMGNNWVNRRVIFLVDRPRHGPLRHTKFLFRFEDLDFRHVYSLPDGEEYNRMYEPNDEGVIDLGDCSVYFGDGSRRASIWVGALMIGHGAGRPDPQGRVFYTTRIHGDRLLFRIEAGYDPHEAMQVSDSRGSSVTHDSGSVTTGTGVKLGTEGLITEEVQGSVSVTGPSQSSGRTSAQSTTRTEQPVAGLIITQIGAPRRR